MKKVVTALVVLASALSLVGCSDDGSSGNNASTESTDAFYRPKNLAIQKVAGASESLLRILSEDDTLTSCQIGASGDLSACENQELNGADVVHQMVVNARTGSMYFLQDDADSILVCNGAGGPISSCAPATGGDTFKDPEFLALNAGGTMAYVANEDNTVTVCSIAGDGTFSSCVPTDANGTLDTPVSIGLVSGAYGTHAYFLNGETKSEVTACTLAPNGMPSTCQAQNDGTFTAPTTIAFSPDGKYAYIGNLDDSVAICSIGNDASLSSCHAIDGDSEKRFAGILKIAADTAGANVYVANARSSTITHCKLTGGGADFADCTPYGIEGFAVTSDFVLSDSAASPAMFITSLYNDSVYGCGIKADGSLADNCIATRFLAQ